MLLTNPLPWHHPSVQSFFYCPPPLPSSIRFFDRLFGCHLIFWLVKFHAWKICTRLEFTVQNVSLKKLNRRCKTDASKFTLIFPFSFSFPFPFIWYKTVNLSLFSVLRPLWWANMPHRPTENYRDPLAAHLWLHFYMKRTCDTLKCVKGGHLWFFFCRTRKSMHFSLQILFIEKRYKCDDPRETDVFL